MIRIHDTNKKKFERRIKRLIKKAISFGLTPPSYEWTGTDEVEIHDVLGPTGLFELYHIGELVDTPSIVIEGFTPIAVVQHESAGNIINMFPKTSVELPVDFREAKNSCDHCHTKRRRKETFVLQNDEDGSFIRVGRNCLADFLGLSTASDIADRLSFLRDCQRFNMEGRYDTSDRRIGIATYLGYVAREIRLYGFLGRGKASWSGESTADQAFNALCLKANRPEQADIETGIAATAWASSLPEDTKNDFLHNLRVACSMETCEVKNIGIVAAAIPAYERHLNREAEKAADAALPPSEWLGGEGDKIGRKLSKKDRDNGVSALPEWEATCIGTFPSEGYYGLTTICKFRDALGRVATWFASGCPDIERGATYAIKATIKAVDTYRGNRETKLTRVVATPI